MIEQVQRHGGNIVADALKRHGIKMFAMKPLQYLQRMLLHAYLVPSVLLQLLQVRV